MGLEDEIKKMQNRIAEIEGSLSARRHDHQRVVQLTHELAEVRGVLQSLADRVGTILDRLNSLEETEGPE
jgi:predicted  nucleic acid-binding Zn-ribbon protein